ncbi:MAG: winged helix DNA-binding protein [Synergistaceae bacterium]|nr:winged helix DNA-binding protein [Synergistaceae bacterium]
MKKKMKEKKREEEVMWTDSRDDDRVREVIDSIVGLVTIFDDAENTMEKIIGHYIAEENMGILKNRSLSLSECHVLHHVGMETNPNGTRLSKVMGMTKSGISKLTAKLQEKGFILTERLPGNQKEICYRLTSDGEKVFRFHAGLHKIAEENMLKVVREYGRGELILIEKFLKKIIAAIHLFSRYGEEDSDRL